MSCLGVWADADAGVGGCAGMKNDGTHATVAFCYVSIGNCFENG